MISRYPALVFTVLLFTNCTMNYIKHDPQAAGAVALDFSTKAFVKREYQAAWDVLLEGYPQRPGDAKGLENMVIQMHPDGIYPSSMQLQEYELVPGHALINVYLTGQTGDTVIYYAIGITNADGKGYTVQELYNNSAPFPPKPYTRERF